MQEKFYQFNRQDNSKVIEDGLIEMEPEVDKKSPPINNSAKLETVVVSKDSERDITVDQEREKNSQVNKPQDILSQPTSLRREGLSSLREKIAKRYISISEMQVAIFERIDELDSNGTLSEELLRKEITKMADENNFDTDDRKVINTLLYHFFLNLKKIREVQNLSGPELLNLLIRNKDLIPLIKGDYHVKVTPYSIHFDFDNMEDFRLFVLKPNTEGEANREYKSTFGLSYYNDGYPVTASGCKSCSETTFRHEIQHKKFSAITIDTILVDKDAEHATRDEILARFSENANVIGMFDHVVSYGFARKYGVEKVLYGKILRDAINAIQELQFMRFKEEEVIGLLSKENLFTWPKIVKRIKRTKVGWDLIRQRKPKRVKRNNIRNVN
jgi:hypothetical protein